jgi:hypothetical protein
MFVQYYFDLGERLRELNRRDEKINLIKKSLMSRGKENSLKLSYLDHIKFLEYWNDTQEKKYTGKKLN